MKKAVTLALTLALVLGLLSGCANNDTPADNAENSKAAETAENFTDEMKIPYAVDLSPEDGADSVERSGDHENSPYFAHPDVYNMESTDTLTMLTHFRTMQQTSEWSCGVTAALMVLDWYDALGDWNEESLAALRHSLDSTELEGYPGTTLNQAIDIFNGVGGFDIISSNDYPDGIWLDDIQGWLSEGKPVMICWNDWGGHWQTIIGYDTMGTENEHDDVFLVADSYDTTDHNQDGYGIYPAERLMYNFTMYGAFPESEGGSDMLFLVASPNAAKSSRPSVCCFFRFTYCLQILISRSFPSRTEIFAVFPGRTSLLTPYWYSHVISAPSSGYFASRIVIPLAQPVILSSEKNGYLSSMETSSFETICISE